MVDELCLWRYLTSGAQALVFFVICEKAIMFNETPPYPQIPGIPWGCCQLKEVGKNV